MTSHHRKASVRARPGTVKNLFSLQACLGTLLASLMLSSLALIASASAATITVGNTGDPAVGDAAKCNVASTCTLRDAIAKAANVTGATAGDTIVFGLPVNSTITLSGHELLVGKNLTIDGSLASSVAISGNQQSAVLEIGNGNWHDPNAAVTVVLKGLVIKDGRNPSRGGGGISSSVDAALTLINTLVSGNTADSGNGGGISNAGILTLANSTVSGNATTATFGKGGGIYNVGTLTLSDSTVSDNRVLGYGTGGGGIYNDNVSNVSLTLIRSTVSGNSASGYGGGLYNSRGTATLISSTISGNTVNGTGRDGGGISNSGTLTLTNSTISNNTVANGSGGGIHNEYGYPIALTLVNSTVAGNTATYGGGGIDNQAQLTLIHGTLAANTIAGGAHSDIWNFDFGNATASAVNTIVHSCAVIANTTRPLTDNGGNLDGGNGCGFTNSSSKSNATLDLGTLADNGGPTPTMMPGANSDAIGFGLSETCRNAPVNGRDQRGYVRPAIGCTSGAADPNGAANDSIFFDGFGFGGQ